MILAFRVRPPFYWLLAGNDGKLVQSGVAASLEELPAEKKIEQRIGILPGDWVTIHQLDLPVKNKKLLEQAIPNALEPDLASDIAELHFVLLRWVKGKSATVAVFARDVVQSALDRCNEAGLAPDSLTPEYFLLPLKQPGSATLALSPDGGVLIRNGPDSGFLLDASALDLWVADLAETGAILHPVSEQIAGMIPPQVGVSVEVWPIGDVPADWMKRQPLNKLANVLPPEYQDRRRQGAGKWPWLMLAASVLLWLGIDLVEYIHLDRTNARINRQMERVFHQMFPDVKRIELGKIRFQAKSEIGKRMGGAEDSGYFTLLDAVAKAARGSRATIQSIDYRKGEMVLYVKLPDYALAERLKQRFDQDRRVQVELIPSGSGDNQVTARYKLRLAS